MTLTDPAAIAPRRGEPHLGRYRGTVVDVDDPKALGRIRLRVPEVLGDVECGWALPSFAVTGDGSGLFAIPPVGAAVWVEFESGDLARPVWVGGWFADGSVPQGAAPDRFVLATPGGHVVTLDDDAGSVTITDSGGATVVLDASGIELAKGGQKLVIGSSSVTINDGALEVT
jgi:phage baseplate assembly protein gpV